MVKTNVSVLQFIDKSKCYLLATCLSILIDNKFSYYWENLVSKVDKISTYAK